MLKPHVWAAVHGLSVCVYIRTQGGLSRRWGREGGRVTADGWTVHGTPVLVCFDATVYVCVAHCPLGALHVYIHLWIEASSCLLPIFKPLPPPLPPLYAPPPPLPLSFPFPFSLHSFLYRPSCLSTMTLSQLWHSGITLSSVHVASPSNCGAWRTAE